MKDLLNEATRRDNQRNVGVFNLVIIQGIWRFTICNN
jgi:hypothetical protein